MAGSISKRGRSRQRSTSRSSSSNWYPKYQSPYFPQNQDQGPQGYNGHPSQTYAGGGGHSPEQQRKRQDEKYTRIGDDYNSLDQVWIHFCSQKYLCTKTYRWIQFCANNMEVVPDQATSICTHCDRAIPAANIDLHYAHCSRNLEKCKVCGDMVPKQHAEDHYLSTHALVACSLCSETMERDILDIHTGENCPLRMITCEFCEFPLPAVDLAEHQEVCGNRTELCHICNKYVRLRELYNHEFNCNSIQDNATGSSRDVRPAERDEGARRRQQNEFSKKRFLFTVAITGIAVILGSIFYQRKPEPSNVH